MRPLTDEETKLVFEKLGHFLGHNLRSLIDRDDGSFLFRLHKSRVYYVEERIALRAESAGKKALVGFGTCLGKFTHGNKFRLKITALHLVAEYAEYRVWLKSNAEMSFLYGNHVVKNGMGRMTANTPAHQGVVVLSMNGDIPLGFGTTAVATADTRDLDPTHVLVFNQSDAGEYLRDESKVL